MKKHILIAFLVFITLSLFSICAFAEEGTSLGLSSLIIESYPNKTVYGAFDELDTDGLSLLAVYSDGSTKTVPLSQIQIKYNNGTCLRVGDDYLTLSYGGKSVRLPVTVNRVAYDLSTLHLSSVTAVYNGRLLGYTESLPKIVGLDGIPLKISALGGGVNAGVYDIVVDFQTESKDYFTPESRVITLTIQPAEAEVVWSDLSFTYDGKSKSPLAHFIDINGNKVNLSVIGAATNAGEGYTATAHSSDANYTLKNSKTSFKIEKANYDMSTVKWNSDSFTYDGSKKSVSISGLPSGVGVKGYSGDQAADAGKYVATATFCWDDKNYNSPGSLTHKWEILPAEYDMSEISFDNAGFVFDGQIHYPVLNGRMPIGADGIKLQYSFSAGARHVSDGVVSVIISFKTDSKNYNLPPDRYSSVYITPMGINVVWNHLNLAYNGEEQSPSALSNKCAIKVLGGKTSVGKYIATATSENSDYYVINGSMEYTIEKAKNAWIVPPKDCLSYEGREIALTGKSKFGDVAYTFYSDPDGKNRISPPTECGKYYAVLSVPATVNYDGLKSSVISFEIIPIVPVSFVAVISADKICAFDKLSTTDFLCSVINNDGSTEKIDSSLVRVLYENGDSFRKTDNTVSFKYDKFILSVQVEVDYADYDLSNVKWQNSSVTYDGNPKSPIITGLPLGLKLAEYIGANVTNAGSYKVYARVEYDRENYNEPVLPTCDFVIKKCAINIPHIKATYNGGLIAPTSDSPLYKVDGGKAYVNAGKYYVPVSLTDSNNYVFAENNDCTANAVFEIQPSFLYVKVFDVKLHLFEPLGEVNYKIILGSLFNGDVLTVTSYREGKRVLLRSENPNYTLKVEAGKITQLPYPTFGGGIIILCIILALGIVIIMVKVIYNNRKDLATSFAMAKCKWRNRNMVVPEPKEMKGIRTVADDKREQDLIKRINNASKKKEANILDLDVDADRADMLITDSLAKTLIKKNDETIYTDGNARGIINLDTISDNFSAGDRVDVNSLKEKGLIDKEVCFIKILAKGRIDKPLTVYANDFSLSAVKMIALTGGQSIRVNSKTKR